MNAYAALLAGSGGTAPTTNGLEPSLLGLKPSDPGLRPSDLSDNLTSTGSEGDEPDFFAVLKGTIEDGEGMAGTSAEPAEDDPTAIEETLEPPSAQQGKEPSELVRVDVEPLRAEWLHTDGSDLIPLLDGDVMPSLTGTGRSGELGTEVMAVQGAEAEPALTHTGGHTDNIPAQSLPTLATERSGLTATVSGGQEPNVTFESPTLSLAATVGDSSPLAPGATPTAAPPDSALLAATAGEPGGIVEATPAILADPDLSLVDPELRTRLDRVIDRMRSEYGHNVKVVEGYRTPERQNALFAQGRSAPGPVVTWTQNSMHSEGLAVDVVVDGSYAPHEGYRRLAQIAKEEGLQTLGPKDPGHLQLSNAGQESEIQGERIARIDQVESTAVPATQAQVAEPARVALRASIAEPVAVARPAAIGQPAEVALPGSDGVPVVSEPPELGDRVALRSTGGDGTDQTLPSLATANGGTTSDEERSFGDRERTLAYARAALRRERSDDAPLRATRREAMAELDPRISASAAGEGTQASPTTATIKTPSIVSAEALHRVTQVRELQELAYPKKLGQVTLRMLDGMSEEARMRVSLMGDGITTSIGVRDLAQADRMRSRIGVLEQALRQRGLEPASTRIAALAGATAADAATLTAQAVNATRLTAEAETFLNWTGPDTGSQDELESQLEDQQPRQQPRDQPQEKQQ